MEAQAVVDAFLDELATALDKLAAINEVIQKQGGKLPKEAERLSAVRGSQRRGAACGGVCGVAALWGAVRMPC